MAWPDFVGFSATAAEFGKLAQPIATAARILDNQRRAGMIHRTKRAWRARAEVFASTKVCMDGKVAVKLGDVHLDCNAASPAGSLPR
jgi:hypothetical protein